MMLIHDGICYIESIHVLVIVDCGGGTYQGRCAEPCNETFHVTYTATPGNINRLAKYAGYMSAIIRVPLR